MCRMRSRPHRVVIRRRKRVLATCIPGRISPVIRHLYIPTLELSIRSEAGDIATVTKAIYNTRAVALFRSLLHCCTVVLDTFCTVLCSTHLQTVDIDVGVWPMPPAVYHS